MRCPSCGDDAHLGVRETRRQSDGSIRRRRRCGACGHHITTVEQISGDRVQVRKSDGRLEPFDRTKLLRGVVKAAVRPHHGNRLAELVENIAQDARAHSDEGIIDSSALSTLVLVQLKEFDPVTHVRYALTQLSRRDASKRTSELRDAGEVRVWLRREYPEVEYLRTPTTTHQVVKRDGRREPFERRKLERSIGLSAKGRGRSDKAVRDLATRLADKVLDELRDQAVVTSGQLASEVLRLLRRTDHIAALRFSSTMKQFASVGDYETEALGLR